MNPHPRVRVALWCTQEVRVMVTLDLQVTQEKVTRTLQEDSEERKRTTFRCMGTVVGGFILLHALVEKAIQ